MPHGLAAGYVSWKEVCAIRDRRERIEILAPLLHFEPLKFLCLSKTKEESSIGRYKPISSVLHTISGSSDYPLDDQGKGECILWEKHMDHLVSQGLKDALCKQSKRSLEAKEVFMLSMLGQKRYLC